VIWQTVETNYWKSYLKDLISEHFEKTQSKVAKKVLENFAVEQKNFVQVCPKEMLDKLSNPLSLKTDISKTVQI
jgi:glutamate synthase (NADPH/NADH) large chain